MMQRKHLIPAVIGFTLLIAGAAIGGTAMYFWIGSNTQALLKSFVSAQAIEAIKHSRLLRDGDTKAVLADREKSLELIANWYRGFEYKEPGDIRLLYSVKEYRDQWGLQMPEDISTYLNELPPKPPSSCELAKQTKKK